MENKEAIEILKKNYPTENYTMLRDALDIAIDSLEKTEQLKNENKKYKDALNSIRWNTFASNPQAMIMKDLAKKALD